MDSENIQIFLSVFLFLTLTVSLTVTLFGLSQNITLGNNSELDQTKNLLNETRNQADKQIQILDSEIAFQKTQIESQKEIIESIKMTIEKQNIIIQSQKELLDQLRKSNGLSQNFDDDRIGTYYSESMDVELYLAGLDINQSFNVAAHEIGHYVWYELISSSDILKYQNVFDKSDMFVSDYARTNTEEDFAETFATYYECKPNLSKVPKDRQFIFE